MKKAFFSFTLIGLCFLSFSFMNSPKKSLDKDPIKNDFLQKKAAFEKASNNETYRTLESKLAADNACEEDINKIIKDYLKILEGSSIDELSKIFEVERSAYGCWWVTVSSSCSGCYGDSRCASYRRKVCTTRQLEYCGSYWSGKSRTRRTYPCC